MKKNGLRNRLLAAALAVVLAVPVTAVSMPAESVQAKTVRLEEDDFSISGDLDDAKKVLNAMMRGDKIIFLCMPDYRVYQIKERLKELTDTDISVKITMQKFRRKSYRGVYYNSYPVITAKASKAYINALKKQNAQIVKEIDPVSSATQELAQEIHDHLSKQESYIFYTNGKPKQIIKNLYPMIKAINKQGVIFKYTTERVKNVDGNVYRVTINKEEAQKYYYACALAEKILNYYKNQIGVGGYERRCDLDITSGLEPSYATYEAYYNHLSDNEKALLNAEGFNEYSDIMKLKIISWARVFAFESASFMRYSHKTHTPGGDLNRLIYLYNQTASGVCEDYAESEEAFFSMLGIDVHIIKSYIMDHAWTEGVAANADGTKIKYKFDYGLKVKDADEDLIY